jgi:Sec7-like guanine-nucleotide exchange factor
MESTEALKAEIERLNKKIEKLHIQNKILNLLKELSQTIPKN